MRATAFMWSMKKVYYIANARMPTERAHGIQLAKMCEAFLEEGIDLELVVPRRKTHMQSVQEFYGLRVGVPVKKLPVIDWYVRGRSGFLISSLTFAAAYFFYLLWKKIFGKSFIVYTTDIDQFSFFLIPFLGASYFAEIHDAKKYTLPFSLLFSRSAGVITINSIIKEELQKVFFIRREKIIIHPNGIDLASFADVPARDDARRALGVPLDRRIVLYVGKCYPWKGLSILPRAARMLSSDILVYLVGGTKNELIDACGGESIPDSLVCTGHRSFTEIPLWLAAADAALLLGTRENEYSYLHTSPMKSFEYMASRCPIVVSATPANKEILSDDEAVFYEPDNVLSLVKSIKFVLGHRSKMQEKVDSAYHKVAQFTWDKRARSIVFFMKRASMI